VREQTAEATRDDAQNGEDEEEDSRPSDAFLASVNEGIRGDVLPTNRRNQRPAQEQQPAPEEEPEEEQQAEALGHSPQESVPVQSHLSYNTRIRTRGSRDQRTLVAEPSTGQVILAPETQNVILRTRQSSDEPEADARSDSSLFVGSERGEEDDSLQEGGDNAENNSVQDAEQDTNNHAVQEDEDGGDNEARDAGSEHEGRVSLAPEDDIVAYLELHGRPGLEQKRPVVKVRADKLAYLEKTVSSKNWTGLNTDCRQTLLRKANESEKRWHKRLRKYGLSKWSGAKDLLWAIDSLNEIIQDSPKMPRADEQNAHFSDNLDDLKKVVTWTQDMANNLGDVLISGVRRDEQNRPAAAAEATTRVFIPLLVLTLCESFRLGGASNAGDGHFEAVSAGHFTNVSLGITSYLIEVIMKLWGDLREYRIKADEDHKPLERLHDQLASFQRSVDEGLRIIEDRDPERLRLAKERDGRIEEARQLEEQERNEEREARMSAFIASTQKIRQSLTSPVQATLPLRSTPQQPFRSTVIDLDGEEEEEDPFEDSRDEDQAIAEQLEQDREEREQEEARQRRIAMLKKQDRRAREKREAEVKARKEAMEKRFRAFIASSQQMRV
jgi:hypothetical protein